MSEENELILHEPQESWSLPSWYDRVSENDWADYEKLAALNYSVEEIALYYCVNPREFRRYYNMIDSPLQLHYRAGVLKEQAQEGFKMISDTYNSNAFQAIRLDKKRADKQFRNTLDEVIFNEE